MPSKKDKAVKILEIIVEVGGAILTVIAIIGSFAGKGKRRK
jgi:hypothetical protein